MATGIKAAGTDLDSIFEPRTTTKIANVEIKSNGGVDISNRFENITSGSGPSATGIKKGGADLNTLFAELGSIGPTVSAQANGQISTIEGLGGSVYAGVQFNTSGTEFEVTQSTGNYDVSQGTWLDTGASSDVWVEFTKTGGTGNWNVLNPSGRQICSGSPSWKMWRVTTGQSQVIGYFSFWNASSGGNLLQQTSTVEWSAERTAIVQLGPSWTISNHDAGNLSICSVTFNSNGSISVVRNGGGDTLPASDNWWNDNPETNIGADYEVAFTAITGNFNSGPAINVWTNIGSAVTYQVQVITKNSPDSLSANNVTFAIRPAGGGSIIDSITGCNHEASN